MNFFTWDTVSTVTGLTTITGLVTQLIKPYIPIPTQIVAYTVATLILIGVNIKNKTFSNIPMSIINGFIIASVASNTVALVNRLT